MANIALQMGVDIVNFDKVCLMLCKTLRNVYYRNGFEISTMDFQPWAQCWQNISYVTVSKHPDI